MLRRKLLAVFGSLVLLTAALGGAAVWSLQRTLARLDRVHAAGTDLVDRTGQLSTTLTAIETELYRLQANQESHLDALIEAVERAQELSERISAADTVRDAAGNQRLGILRAQLAAFQGQVSTLATAQDAAMGLRYNYTIDALQRAMALHGLVAQVDRDARRQLRADQAQLAGNFRRLVLVMGLGCLVVINGAVLALLWAAGKVLRPVDQLLQASRQLQQERFDHRTHLAGKDEFSELAEAYNSLAERVQQHEKRRMETISQMALTLNHELNNAISTIEMQLQLMGQRSGEDDRTKTSLQQIRQSLHRMARTVESIKHIKRIVLTDYIAGVKMLDLHRSTQDQASDPPAETSPLKAPNS